MSLDSSAPAIRDWVAAEDCRFLVWIPDRCSFVAMGAVQSTEGTPFYRSCADASRDDTIVYADLLKSYGDTPMRLQLQVERPLRDSHEGIVPTATVIGRVGNCSAKQHTFSEREFAEAISQSSTRIGLDDGSDLDDGVSSMESSADFEVLTSYDVKLVQDTFMHAMALGVENFGSLIFTQFHRNNPEVYGMFDQSTPRRRDEGVKSNTFDIETAWMRRHGGRLVQTLATAISLLDDWQAVVPHLKSMGLRHASYGASLELYDSLGEALLLSLRNVLGDKMTPSATRAYDQVYRTIVDTMWHGGRLPIVAVSMEHGRACTKAYI